MLPQHEILFEKLTVGELELKNRIVVPPLVQIRHITSPEGLAWYKRLASGGAGLIIVEATGIFDIAGKLTADDLRPLVDTIHACGAAVAIQLTTGGIGEKGNPLGDEGDPNEFTIEQLDEIVATFGEAARICIDAGFDAVQPHGAHGYVINLFSMPEKNQRSDEYGGSLENRCRLGVRVVESIKSAIGDDGLILYRHTPVRGGTTMEEALVLAEKLIAAGADVLDISPARDEIPADIAAPFKERFDVPVIAVQGMSDPDAAADALTAGRCDLVAIGRGMIADAQWPNKVADERFDDILKCVECNEGCYGGLEARKPVVCTHWKQDEVAPFMA